MNKPTNLVLSCRDIVKSYLTGQSTVCVLNGTSFDIAAGSLTALIGSSGSGKSTLLNCLAGLDFLDGGSIDLAGTKISELSQDEAAQFRLQNLGLVFQFFNLLPTLTVFDNVAIPLYLSKKNNQQLREIVNRNLEQVGLLDKSSRYPDQLSGGEVQRVAIARALVNDPAIVFADEPTGNLDQNAAGEIISLFRRLVDQRGVTLLLVTHDRENIKAADLVLELHHGQVIEMCN